MFGNDPILVHDILGQVYAFTRWRRPISDELSERDVFGEDRTYAKQTLRSIATYQQHDPFNYRLYDVWQMVFEKPWTRPATLNDLINDLAEAAHNGRLFAYLESSWLDQAPETSSGLGGGAADGGGGSDEVADEPRTQARLSNSNGPGQAFLAPIPPPPVAPAPVATAPAQLTFMQRAAAGLTTFTKVLRTASPWSLLAYSGGLGGSLDEVVADDGTVYRKYSSELIYNAAGPDGSQWQTASPQEDMEYRTWLANGGDGSMAAWRAQGKPGDAFQDHLASSDNIRPLREQMKGLTPDEQALVRDFNAGFSPQGVSKSEALEFILNTETGQNQLKMAKLGDPGADNATVLNRVLEQVQSGTSVPVERVIETPLVKIVPHSRTSAGYGPFFTTPEQLETARSTGRPLSDVFGLPGGSDAAQYRVFQIQPKGTATVFESTIAPTTELGGKLKTQGGLQQFLVPNRNQFEDAVEIDIINDNFNG